MTASLFTAPAIAAGANTSIGVVTGAVLLGVGVGDLRHAQRSRSHARVRVTPALTGLQIVGRF